MHDDDVVTEVRLRQVVDAANAQFKAWHDAQEKRRVAWQEEHDNDHEAHSIMLSDIGRRQDIYRDVLKEQNRILADVAQSLRILSKREP